MLYLNEASDIRPLVRSLAELMADPLEDPMAREWVAVPTSGMQRWTKLEISRSLGSTPEHEDGISANIDFNFPGKLRQIVVDASRQTFAEVEPDPWHIDQLVWTVLEVIDEGAREDLGRVMPNPPEGSSIYSRARRIADLFDRYAIHRPELIVRWSKGENVDALGNALATELAWQPELWRRVRDHIGEESSPERFGELLDEVRAGQLVLDLPSRLSIFGITALPGGGGFTELIDAIAGVRDVHCFFLEPSPVAAGIVEAQVGRELHSVSSLRSHDRSEHLLHHPLLISWGSPFRERAALLALAGRQRGFPPVRDLDGYRDAGGAKSSGSLLARVQHNIRGDRAPDGTFKLASGDTSIQIHGCYGLARQVEVLRDLILHLLQDDRDLEEEDIVVLCPAIEDFAPHIEAGFGPPISGSWFGEAELPGARETSSAAFSYHMSDRSLWTSNPLLQAFEALLELVGGRFSATEVLEFISLEPVRRRFSLREDAVETIIRWTRRANVRWGLNADHRIALGFTERYELNSWRAALESLLIGVTTRDIEFGLAEGEIAPIGVEGDEIEIVGQFAELLDRLEVAAANFAHTRSPRRWCEDLEALSRGLFEVDPSQSWQTEALRRVLARISESSISHGRERAVEIPFADIRRALSESLRGSPGRSDFFRGGVTVTSMTPLRWIPFKVVCLLGLDGAFVGDTEFIGDDVIALAPQLGDPDSRSEMHQSILEAVLSAQKRLVVTFTSHDPQTNLPVPRSVEFLELEDTVLQTLEKDSQQLFRQEREIIHPRQSYDERNFFPGRLGHSGSWSFDVAAFLGAQARRNQESRPRPLLRRPLAILDDDQEFSLEFLREFLRHPVRSFLRTSLQVYRPFERTEDSDELPLTLEPLKRFDIGSRLLAARLGASPVERWEVLSRAWWAREEAQGALPVGQLARIARAEIEEEVDALVDTLGALGIETSTPDVAMKTFSIDVMGGASMMRRVTCSLDAGSHICRDGANWQGTWSVRFSKLRPADELIAWLDLLVLTVHAPSTRWTAVSLRRTSTGTPGIGVVSLALEGDSNAARLESARTGIAAVVRLAELGRIEPLPLFGTFSKKLYAGVPGESDWADARKNTFTDGNDRDNVLAFGAMKLAELLEIPARDSDPGEGPTRATRLAHFLWGTFAATAITEELPILGWISAK